MTATAPFWALGSLERGQGNDRSRWQAMIYENDTKPSSRLVCVVYGTSRAVALDRATRIIRAAQDEIDRGNKP